MERFFRLTIFKTEVQGFTIFDKKQPQLKIDTAPHEKNIPFTYTITSVYLLL